MRAWATGIAAATGVGLAVYPLTLVGDERNGFMIGLAGLAFMTAALVSRRARPLAFAAANLFGLHYGVGLHVGRVELDAWAPLVALGLFVFLEATDLATSVADVAPMKRDALVRRLRTSLVVGVAGSLVALLAVVARSLFTGAVAGVVVGAACIAGLMALPLWLAQGRRSTP